MTARVTVIGEALVDLLWPAGAREARAVAGGSPANVAVGLHRLERPATLLTAWGEDPPGELVREHLAATGVDVRRVASGAERTMVALAYLGGDGVASYDFLAAWDPRELPVPADTAVVHTGSLAVVLEPGAARVLDACRAQRRQGRAVAADLNVRPAVQPDRDAYRAACARLAAEADVLKASDEDLAWLYPGRAPAEAARALLDAGPRLVAVTLGAAGALAVTAGEEVRVPAPAVEVADTVGAGDTFQAALLDAVAAAGGPPQGREALAAVLARCAAAAAITCTRVGADPPTRAELEAFDRA
ncbi:PfkB family carbohydrate kinase [Streptomyces sp. DSM 44917]|uniref:PfkB family carbohydrate kinase n=1 Tax=Streptomyces boetiae TaxID=3075541 RepID=A0ABU2L578_9ACTN|nr:PfkB family carbohydrate kinase [Streptomyces sp. DSM 44917]MDT0306532.1 PfkB family carbohydrate kinase [Streptomyces sp. DSM 44917]